MGIWLFFLFRYVTKGLLYRQFGCIDVVWLSSQCSFVLIFSSRQSPGRWQEETLSSSLTHCHVPGTRYILSVCHTELDYFFQCLFVCVRQERWRDLLEAARSVHCRDGQLHGDLHPQHWLDRPPLPVHRPTRKPAVM